MMGNRSIHYSASSDTSSSKTPSKGSKVSNSKIVVEDVLKNLLLMLLPTGQGFRRGGSDVSRSAGHGGKAIP